MEYWDLYDINGRKLNRTHMRGTTLRPGTYHLVVSNWIRNDKGDFLIQKRTKPLGVLNNPWSSTAGAALMGESSLEAIRRETEEEMGIAFKYEDFRFIERAIYSVFFKDVYETIWNGVISEINFDPKEVADVKWVTTDELCQMYHQSEFFDHRTGYFDSILNRNK